jgi:hypothetical protein
MPALVPALLALVMPVLVSVLLGSRFAAVTASLLQPQHTGQAGPSEYGHENSTDGKPHCPSMLSQRPCPSRCLLTLRSMCAASADGCGSN